MLPVISPSATTPDLFHAFGFCGHGFQLGPGVGIVVSEFLVDGATPTPLGDFSITRFNDPDWAGSEAHAGEFDRALLHPA
jgi:sarcosine oxidase subunit beta